MQISMKTYQKPHAKTKRILAYRLKHPKASVSWMANALNATYPSIYNALSKYDALYTENLDHLNALVEGYTEPEEKPSVGQQVLRTVIHKSNEELDDCQREKAHLHQKITELEHLVESMKTQLRGLGNVITYLESKLGMGED